MKTLTSKLAIGAGAVLGIVIVALLIVLGQIDRIVKRGVETAGPQITGTSVELGSANISLFSGKGSLGNLQVGNPAGFSTPQAFQLGEIALELDPRSVTAPVVHVRSITVTQPWLTVEYDGEGRKNLDVILDHARGTAGDPGKEAKPTDKSAGAAKRMIIDHLHIVGAQVHVIAAPLNLDLTLPLPDIELKELGAREGGATAAVIAEQVLKEVIGSALSAARSSYLKAKGQEWAQDLKNKAGELFDSIKK